jgi:hypothetical protein
MDEQQRIDKDFFQDSIKKKAKKGTLVPPQEKIRDTKNGQDHESIVACVHPADDCIMTRDEIAIAYFNLESAMTDH